jgi:hypothetical protein
MRTIQKLELSSGIAALLAGVFQIIFFVFTVEQGDDHSTVAIIIYGILFLLLPLIIINVCTYFHVTKNNMIGFGILLILGSIFVCFFGFLAIAGFLLGHEMKTITVIGIFVSLLPVFLVVCTILFSLFNIASSPSSNKDIILQ